MGLFNKDFKDVPSVAEELKVICDALNKEFKEEVAVPGDGESYSDKAAIRVPTSSFMLNLLLGGGIPQGRVIEVFGDPSHGKSTLIEHMMIGFQRFPGLSILLDAEAGWDRDRAVRMGHSTGRSIHLLCDTVETAFATIHSTIKRLRMPGTRFPVSVPIGIFYDTLAASQTESEKDGDRFKGGMIDKARKVREALRTLSLVLPKTNCSLIIVNQVIECPGKMGGPSRKTTPAGSSVKFWASMRLSVFSSQRMDYPEENTGIITNVRTVKNKLDAPNREIQLPIRYRDGVDNLYEVLNYVIDNSKFANMSSGRVSMPDYPVSGKNLSFYYKDAYSALRDNPDLVDYLQICAEATWNEKYKFGI